MRNRTEPVDVCVIGAGPKGLSLAHELKDADFSTCVLENRAPGSAWQPSHINPRLTLHPAGWEITNFSELSFQTFWDKHYPDTRKTQYPRHHGCFTAAHFRHYLRWLARDLPITRACATNVHFESGRPFEVSAKKDIQTEVIQAHCVVLATGMIGYGGQEFVHDPTGIRGISTKVAHTPADIRTDRDVVDFLGDAKHLAIIGGANSATGALWHLTRAVQLKSIHVFSNSDFGNVSTTSPWASDPDGSVISSIPPWNLELLRADSRIVVHCDTRVKGAREESDKVVIVTEEGECRFDRVILGTGYRYDFGEIPLAQDLVARSLISLAEQRYPLLSSDHSVASTQENIQLYVIGEGALALGRDQRWLCSTKSAVRNIRESIRRFL